MKWEDLRAFGSVLTQCSSTRNLREGKRLHSFLSEHGLDRSNTYIGNLLVKMYGDCGLAPEAWDAFVNIEKRNSFSWNIMGTAYARNGQADEAGELFERMPCTDVVSWNNLISLHARFKDLERLNELFHQMPERNACTWNAILAANAHTRNLISLNSLFFRMPSVQVVTWNTMITAHGDGGDVRGAKHVFDTMSERELSSWNAMVSSYAENRHLEQAKEMLCLMPMQTISPWNALITCCSTSGDLEQARLLFDTAPERNVISWSTLMTAYAQNGQGREAVQMFRAMDLEGIGADNVAFISVIYACAAIPAVAEGRIIYRIIQDNGLPQDVPLGNNLINMFAKCGSLESAREVFDNMAVRDPLAWNTMITAYSQAGETMASFELFHTMILLGIRPADVTFVSVLSSCSHAGLVRSAREHFHSMSVDFEIAPVFEHFRCMIDVLGRVGQLERAEELIRSMPFKPDAVIWNTLLSACKNHDDLQRASRVGEQVFQIDTKVWSSYVLLSSTFFAHTVNH